MSDWKDVLLTDITSKIGDGLHGTPKYDNSGEYYFINGNNLVNGKIIIKEDTKRVTEDEFLKYAKPINERTLLLGINGTIGNVAYYKGEKCMLGKSACYINVNDDVDLDFIYYTLVNNDFQNYIEGIATGTTIPNVPLKGLRDYTFKIPHLPLQTAIASILSSLDDKIDLLHRQNATLEKMAETLFRQWFVEEAKEEWETDSLGKLFDIGIGRTPPRKEHQWFSENPVHHKWVSIKDMGNSGIYISNVSEYLTNEAVERFSIPIIPENTVLLSFKMTIGRLAITTEKMLSNEAIAHFKVKTASKLFSEFLYLYLKTYQWEQLGSTSSIVEAINSQMIKEMQIIIPDNGLLMEFKDVVRPYFEKIKSNQTQIRTLTALRDTLLPKLMSGEITIAI